MAVKNDGGQAFPKPYDPYPNVQEAVRPSEGGMSMRQWYAGQAMIGIMSGQMMPGVALMAKERSMLPADLLAQMCFEQADAMIKASEQ